MKRACSRALLILLLIVSAPLVLAPTAQQAPQRVVRGMLFRGDKCCDRRASGLAVRVTHEKFGPSSFAYSGNDGMYYLYNVPPGDYTLEVWLSSDPKSVLRFPLHVTGDLITDVPTIRVP